MKRIKLAKKELDLYNSITRNPDFEYELSTGIKVSYFVITSEDDLFEYLTEHNMLHRRFYDGLNCKILIEKGYYEASPLLHSEEFEEENTNYYVNYRKTLSKIQKVTMISAGAILGVAVTVMVILISVLKENNSILIWTIIPALLLTIVTQYIIRRVYTKRVEREKEEINIRIREKHTAQVVNDSLERQNEYVNSFYKQYHEDLNEEETLLLTEEEVIGQEETVMEEELKGDK